MVDRLELGWRLPLALLAGGLVACAGAPRAGGPAWADDPCALGSPAAPAAFDGADPASGAEHPDRAVEPIVVALPGPIDPAHAPVPRTESERLVFTQLYETLVRITCEARVVPALAASWQSEEEGRRWTFTLRSDARDWDGVPVTAADVGSSWLAARQALAGEPATGPWPRVRRVGVEGPRTLVVELDGPATIALFAHPAFGVRTVATPTGWPIGTGPHRPPAEESPSAGPRRSLSMAPTGSGLALELRTVSGDPRNALDAGVDLLVTADPEAIEYAASSADFHTVPLGWDRGYVLAARAAVPPAPPLHPAEHAADSVAKPAVHISRAPDEALAGLARDAVSAEARSALGLAETLAVCLPATNGLASARGAASGRAPSVAGQGVARPPAGRRIVYPTGDVAARSLAERLVALALDPARPDAAWLEEAVPALTGGEGRVRAAGLPAADFAAALRAGKEAAYLIPLEGAGDDACDRTELLLARAPWLTGSPTSGGDDRPAIVPLVETRPTLLLRRGLVGVVVDGRGALRLEGLRRAAGGAP